jgi:hypothetical protein
MDSYSRKREINKLGLETFFLNLENNHYDFNIDKLISNLEEKLNVLDKKKLNKKLDDVIELDNEIEIIFLYKELFAISEMKIIYAYKHLEIHLKFILKASYENSNENDFYRWESIVAFLKTKNIKLSEVSDYTEINELRNINNSIKHSRSIINEKTKNILEFKNKKQIQYSDLLSFYKRIENSTVNFISSLSNFIQKDLCEFDDERIEKIAQRILLRMEKNDVDKLVSKLK